MTISNPNNCSANYTISNSADNSTYTGNDLNISESSGIVSSNSNNNFTTGNI